jgi:hypothetical protein
MLSRVKLMVEACLCLSLLAGTPGCRRETESTNAPRPSSSIITADPAVVPLTEPSRNSGPSPVDAGTTNPAVQDASRANKQVPRDGAASDCLCPPGDALCTCL